MATPEKGHSLTNLQLAEDLERLICALADIATAERDRGQRKAKRLYDEMRVKYPIEVKDALEQSIAPTELRAQCPIHMVPLVGLETGIMVCERCSP